MSQPVIYTVPVTIRDIRAWAEVTHYEPPVPPKRARHCRRTGDMIEPGSPPEGGDVEFHLTDKRGRRLERLETIVSGSAYLNGDVVRQVVQGIERRIEDGREAWAEGRRL